MTTTHEQGQAAQGQPTGRATATPPVRPPAAGHKTTVRQQRRPMMIGLGAALLALGGIGGGWLATQGGQTVSVLTVRAGVPAGHRISASDLGTTQINKSAAVTSIPAADSDQVTGRYAVSTLPSGTLLTPTLTAAKITPTSGRAIVGVALTPSQMPTTGLHPGDTITLVVGATSKPVAGDDGPKTGTSWTVTVIAVGHQVHDDGTITVDVDVPDADAAELAATAASGALVAVLDHPTDGE